VGGGAEPGRASRMFQGTKPRSGDEATLLAGTIRIRPRDVEASKENGGLCPYEEISRDRCDRLSWGEGKEKSRHRIILR